MKKKVKKYWRRTSWCLYKVLPRPVRAGVVRRLIDAQSPCPHEITIKVGSTQSELEQAFRLLYDSFLELGYIPASQGRLRLTKYHAIPGAAVIIAKCQETVVATLSIIPDSPFGLPLESTWNIDFLRQDRAVVAEISALAVARVFLGANSHALAYLRDDVQPIVSLRSTRRYRMKAAVVLQQNDQLIAATLIDVSESGFRLAVVTQIDPGASTSLRLVCPNDIFLEMAATLVWQNDRFAGFSLLDPHHFQWKDLLSCFTEAELRVA